MRTSCISFYLVKTGVARFEDCLESSADLTPYEISGSLTGKLFLQQPLETRPEWIAFLQSGAVNRSVATHSDAYGCSSDSENR